MFTNGHKISLYIYAYISISIYKCVCVCACVRVCVNEYLLKKEVICDVLLWTPSHQHTRARCPTIIYILQLCSDTGYCLEDLLRALADWDGLRVRD